MPSPLRKVTLFLTTWRNAVDYPLRQAFHFHRGGVCFRNESKGALFADLPPADRHEVEDSARCLLETYHLESLYHHSTAENYRENLFYLEIFERALVEGGATLPARLVAADIGPSHWFYVQALYGLLRYWRSAGREVSLLGWEADPYRVYTDLRSRYDHAIGHLNGLSEARYMPEGFRREPGAYDLIAMLFPFVFVEDHLEWGLPRPMFDPLYLLAEAWGSLKMGGSLIIVNQGEAEHEAQKENLAALGITPRAAFRHDSPFFKYDLPRYVLVGRRDE